MMVWTHCWLVLGGLIHEYAGPPESVGLPVAVRIPGIPPPWVTTADAEHATWSPPRPDDPRIRERAPFTPARSSRGTTPTRRDSRSIPGWPPRRDLRPGLVGQVHRVGVVGPGQREVPAARLRHVDAGRARTAGDRTPDGLGRAVQRGCDLQRATRRHRHPGHPEDLVGSVGCRWRAERAAEEDAEDVALSAVHVRDAGAVAGESGTCPRR